ncbi:YihA family ribosome biogenesis GTP-binding protein, partial [Clostridium botulinum]|nr:YihA family ribosome biogenesis GTP-binding protein [Clostridium botulinum]
SDKLKNAEFKKSEKLIRDTLNLTKDDKLYFYSSLNKKGTEELIDKLFLEFATDID